MLNPFGTFLPVEWAGALRKWYNVLPQLFHKVVVDFVVVLNAE